MKENGEKLTKRVTECCSSSSRSVPYIPDGIRSSSSSFFCCCVFQGKSRGIKFSSFPYAMHFRLVFISFMVVVVVMRRQEPPMSATTTRHCGSHALDTEAIHPPPFSLFGSFVSWVCTRWGSKDDEERRSLGRWPGMSVCVFLSLRIWWWRSS